MTDIYMLFLSDGTRYRILHAITNLHTCVMTSSKTEVSNVLKNIYMCKNTNLFIGEGKAHLNHYVLHIA